jgi:hypothetical protein
MYEVLEYAVVTQLLDSLSLFGPNILICALLLKTQICVLVLR